jgi:sugar phosphate isomerase/epimerase
MKLSRRKFIETLSAAGLAASVGGRAVSLFAREPHLKFPARPADRLALTSWPFRAYMESPTNSSRDKSKPGMDIVGFAKMAIERYHIHNINPLLGHFRSEDMRHIVQVREGVEKLGSKFVDLGLDGGRFFDPDAARRAADIAQNKKWIDLAAALGSPSVRPHIRGSHGAKPDVDLAAASLGQLADYGARKNVVVNLENDNLVNEDPFFIVRVIEKAANPYLRALPDFGNTMAKGDAAYNLRGLKAMFRHAFDMSHVKDEIVSDSGKIYKIDLPAEFAIAKASGYRGYFSMEFDTDRGDPFEGTARLVRETLHDLS